MATPTFSNTYEIEDTQTGKFYRVEGVDGTTREEAISWLETLDNDQLAQREIKKSAPVAVSNPSYDRSMDVSVDPVTAPVATGSQTAMEMEADRWVRQEDPSPLSADDEAEYVRMSNDLNVTPDQIGTFLAERGKVFTPQAAQELNDYRKAVAAGEETSNTVSYTNAATDILGAYTPDEDPDVGGWGAALERGMAYNPVGIVTRLGEDWFDADQGGISKDQLRKLYPDLNDDAIEGLHDGLIGELRRRELVNAGYQIEEKNVGIAKELIGDLIGGLSPFDLVAPYRSAKVIGQVAEGAYLNAGLDAMLQANDIAYGAQQEYNYAQTAIAAGVGGVLSGGIGAGTRAVSKRLSKAPTDSDGQPTVRVPQNRKGSKKYREQLTQTSEDVAEVINTATRDWQNKPDITVHDNFNDLEGIDSDAIGVYLGEGKVAINTEAVLKEAKRLNVDPADITRAVTFHESLGHFGLAKQYGDDLDEVLGRWYDNNEGKFKDSVDEWLAANPKAYLNEPNRRARAAEEVLAEMSEKGQIDVKLLDQIKNVVKNFARDLGFDWKVTDREVRSLLAMSHAQVGSKQAYARVTPNEVPEGSPRYMKPGRVDGSRIDVETMNADDLFESENALDLLRGMTSKYDPSVISFDDLRAEAEARGLNPSDILRSKTGNPGDVARRLMMYDIAAEKANNKLANLYNKMNSGQFTAKDKQEYLKTMAQAQEMFAKIFGEQSEAGRALRAIQNLNYTRKRMSNLEKALGGLQNATKNEEDFLRFMREYHNSLDEQAAKKPSKIARFGANALNTPRALMSSLDLSAPLRQGIFLIGRKEFWKALPSMFKYFGSDDAYKSLMRDIVKRPTYPAMVEGKLAFSSLDGKLSSREEDFMSEWADKVPGVRPSNRAYTGFLNKLRADTFDSIYTKMQEAGVDFKADPKALKDLGTYISNATGRGDLGRFNSSAPLLTAALFSPRLLASRVNMLRPDLYYKMHPAVRKQALRDLALFGGAALTVATLGSLAGADVEIDPRSSDFGKLRVGNTRYDILGGFGQYLTLGARMAMFLGGSTYEKLTGEEGPDHYKTTSTGETKKYNDPSAGLYGQKAGGAVTQFFRNKLAPVPSYVVDAFMGENVVGEEFSAGNDILKRVVPMFAQDVYEMTNEYGTAQGVAMSAPGIFGVGVQNFTPTNLDPEAEVEAPESFTDNSLEDGENDFVTVKDGEVKLKPETQKEWQRRVNIYVQEWMKDEVAAPEWKTYTNKEKAEVIKEVRADARAQTKEDMMEVMGL